MRKTCLLIAAALWNAFLAAPPARAALDGSPEIYGQVIRDYARILFEWPEPVYFTATIRGNTLFVRFDEKSRPNFGRLLKTLHPYVISASIQADGKTMVLHLNQPYRIRTFMGDRVSGVDLLATAPASNIPAALPKTLKAAAPPPRKPSASLAKAKIRPEPELRKAKEQPIIDSAGDAAALLHLAPSAGAAADPAQQPTPAASTPPPSAVTAKTAEAVTAAPAISEPQPAPDHASRPAAPPPMPEQHINAAENEDAHGSDASAIAKITPPSIPAPAVNLERGDAASAEEPDDGRNTLKITVSDTESGTVLRFPFRERVAAAVFERARTLWVVFNATPSLDLSEFENLSSGSIGKPLVLQQAPLIAFRIPLHKNAHISVAKEENAFDWTVLITPSAKPLANPISLSINTEPPAPPHVFLSTLETVAPVTVRDPDIGDDLIVSPVYKENSGVPVTRDFVEFSVLATAQGIAVRKKSDSISAVQLRNGLRIATRSKSTLSPNLPAIDETKADKLSQLKSLPTLFPYNDWKLKDHGAFRHEVRRLFHILADRSNLQETSQARLRLAQLYFSEGMIQEALGMLDVISDTNPNFYQSQKLSALRGAANFLMYRFIEASKDFSAVELKDIGETAYWQALLRDLLGSPDQSFNFLALNADYISKYPPLLRQRLAIVAADRSIASSDYNTALKIFDTLQEDKLLDPIKPYADFLMGKISAETNQEKDALEIWGKLAEANIDPFVRARAQFTLTAWKLERGMLDKNSAIDQLERLRLGWHGDSLELNALAMLGDLYAEKREYAAAIRAWHNIVTSFANTALAVDASRRMQEAFVALFGENGAADQMPLLDALALYYEFRNFTPQGDVGNQMVEHLADRLIAVDLLEQAATLLDYQMRTQMEKEDRSRSGAKLAAVHLLNRQPEKALQALQESVYGENSAQVKIHRNRLSAQAMADLGQADKALATLGQDNSPEAEMIRLDIYWENKDWRNIILISENLLKQRKEPTAPIDLTESNMLMRLALAYMYTKDVTQLYYLRDYFGPLMSGNPNESMFAYLTREDFQPTPQNFETIMKELSKTRHFLGSYKTRIEIKDVKLAAAVAGAPDASKTPAP